MRVSHFNTTATGGSAVLMLRLHRSLRQAGVDSRVYYRSGHSGEFHTAALDFAGSFAEQLRERIKWRIESWLLRDSGNLFSPVRAPVKTTLPTGEPDADVYHFHWISRWLDFSAFLGALPPAAPLVFTLHDLGNIAGGCHLYSGCHGFEQNCRPCPLLKGPFSHFLAHWELQRKQRCLRDRRVYVVGNSRWTTNLGASAAVFRGAVSCRTIHPAIDPAEFVPVEKSQAKRTLGIPADQLTIGFGCASLTDRNKNFPTFLGVLERLSGRRKLQAIVFGDGFRKTEGTSIKVHSLGKLESSRLLSLAYSAMDVFVMTSQIETFGQVALEAQACGTPVCAFNVGGLSDAVRHDETGLLSQAGNADALIANIDFLLKDEARRKTFADRGHEWAYSRFTLEAATRAYQELYEEAVGGATPARAGKEP